MLFSTLLPSDVTLHYSDRFPVTVYMLEGIFTLELTDREPVRGQGRLIFVEPAGISTTGFNRGEAPARMVLFYACAPDAPFADSVNKA